MSEGGLPSAAPTTDDRLHFLDGYRALAALAVVCFHVGGASHWVSNSSNLGLDAEAWRARLGNYGVTVFFLLSGLVLYRPFLRASLLGSPAPTYARYLRRRVVRIFPAYLAALSVFFILGLSSVKHLSSWDYVVQYLLLINYDDRGFLVSIGVSWTLCIEIAFYLALPLLAMGIRHLPGGRSTRIAQRVATQLGGLALMVLAAWAYRIFLLGVHPDVPGNAPGYLVAYLDWFALGMALAVALEARAVGVALPRWLEALASSTLGCWLLAAELYWLSVQLDISGVFYESGGKTLARFALNGISALLLLLPAVLAREPGRALRALDARPLVFLGTISYGIYLWHPLVLRVTERADVPFSTVSRLAFVLATSIPLAYLSLRVIERPTMYAERRYARRHRPERTVTVAPA